MKRKIGVVDVGGGLRGIYAAGVLDYCLDNDISFDLGIGVSAGSANLASYSAKQPRRNLQFYTEYALRKEYMGIGNFIKKKSFLDLDYIYGTLSNSGGESPLDYNTLMQSPIEMFTVATEAATGYPVYFNKHNLSQNHYDIFKASSAIPFVCQPYKIAGIPFFDGALADPVPIKKAFELGCDKVVLILTLPKDTTRSSKRDKKLANRIKKSYPLAAKKLEKRASLYNESIELAKQYEKEGKVLIISPDDTCGVDTLSKDVESMQHLYTKGYVDGRNINAFIFN